MSKETLYDRRDMKRLGLAELKFEFRMGHLHDEDCTNAVNSVPRGITGMGRYAASVVLDAAECERVNAALEEVMRLVHVDRAAKGIAKRALACDTASK